MNTIIITDKEEIKEKISENLALLRTTDNVLYADYDTSPEVLYNIRPEIIIIHENTEKDKTINLIKYIREKHIYYFSQIILAVNEYNKSFILSAYDEGINDYFLVDSDPSEILIRTINCIKKYDTFSLVNVLKNNLKSFGVLESRSGFYTSKYEKDIFDSQLHENSYKNGCYMILAPDTNFKSNFSSEVFVNAIKSSVRVGDFVASLSGAKYSILVKADLDGCLKILKKIQLALSDKLRIKAGIAVIDSEKFDDIKMKATCAMNNALLKDVEYFVYSSDAITSDDWLVEETQHNVEKPYKLFKNAFSKKIENVIAPVFYRVQKSYEEKLDGAKIEQFADEKQSVFRIISGKNESRITMRYPGYSKLIIYISHNGLDSPDNREITLPMNEITEYKLDEIMESFVNEFIGIYRHIYSD